jgi:hypothetical protein
VPAAARFSIGSFKDGLLAHHLRRGRYGRGIDCLSHDAGQRGSDVGQGQAVVHCHVGQRARGHAGLERRRRILHDRLAAAALDGGQAGGAVIEVAGEHHADHALTPLQRGRPEQGVQRRPRMVLAGTAREPHLGGGEQHVVIGGRDMDRPGFERLPGPGMDRRPVRPARQQVGQDAVLAAHVQDQPTTALSRAGRPAASSSSAKTPPVEAPMTMA